MTSHNQVKNAKMATKFITKARTFGAKIAIDLGEGMLIWCKFGANF